MRVRNVGETKDLQMWASAHSNLFSQEILTKTFETEEWYRENLDMPYLTKEEWDAGQEVLKAAAAPFGNAAPANGNGNGNGKGGVDTQNVRSGTGNTNTTPGAESVS